MPDDKAKVGQTTQDESDDVRKFVTEEQLNKAITARTKAFEKKIDDALSGIVPSLREEFTKLLESTPKGETKTESKTQSETPELLGLKRQIADLDKQAKQLAQERDDERRRAKESELRQKLADELSRYGVEKSKHAVGFLVDAEKRVRWSDDGSSIVYKDTDGSDIDLTTGVKSFVQSDDGKIYLPPRGTSGTGGRPQKKAGGTADGVSRADIEAALIREIFEK